MAKMILSFLQTFSLLFIFLIPSLCCPQYQKEALLQFKLLLLESVPAHQNLTFLETWNSSSTDCCQWEEVGCNSNTPQQQVTDLDLSNIFHNSEEIVLSSHVLTPLFHVRTLETLDISSNNIQGEISAIGFANLTEIVELKMSDNMFDGSIPPELFSLKHLEILSLDRTFIEATKSSKFFPLGNLTNLQVLSLANNRITGAIPSSLCRLKELQQLDLHSNFFSKQIPAQIGNLSEISYMLLNDNDLVEEIPPSMQKMRQLKTLNLEDNQLSGEIPAWLFDFRNLTDLKLGGNKLVWKNSTIVPKSKLSALSLRSCSVSGHMPFFLSNFTDLSFLDLSGNNLLGTLPLWLNHTKYFELILSDNNLSGSPFHFFSLTYLQRLDLSGNNFSGKLPDNIGEATHMTTLLLSGNDFSGPIPKSISNMSLLSILDLSKNRLSSNEFPNFKAPRCDPLYALAPCYPLKFNPLSVLLLGHNEFSGILPRNLTNLSELVCLDLHDNNFTGELPAFLFQISSLQILNLRNNSFHGSIPNDLTDLTSLQILDLSDNNFSGEVPSSLGKLSGMINPNLDASLLYYYEVPASVYQRRGQISSANYPNFEVSWKNKMQDLPSKNLNLYTFLDLSNNQLSGGIPDTLGCLRNLKVLNMSHNKLSGGIPTTLGDMNNLESLDLSHNNLSGKIPQTFGKLLQLTTLELSNNKLTGSIPSGRQMDTMNNPNSYANNSGLCGMQIQVPCDKVIPEPEESRSQETWFSWVMAGIGFPFGFLSTVLVFYVIGYFDVVPKRRQRRRLLNFFFGFLFFATMSEFVSTLLFGDNQEFESFPAEELQGFMARLRQIESGHESSSPASRIPLLFLMGDDNEALSMVELANGHEDASKVEARGASIEYIEKLGEVTMEGSGMVCAVCLDEMSIGSEARRLPCLHVYHSNCIVEWLKKNKTCPCRTS
ncbi:hypothetical protein GH714_006850 [Hevea brasiliensis]|uniref:RING-type domain-containing protein n=1 Tax=Hevea brasiliensis TaxID=3981 RepID=A0A6A6LX60_HEVBR|nr:hypothetical protein GH714_006850 [Hevea brasiliensis]